MNIDAHQHFWRYTPEAYRWIRTDTLKQNFMPEDLAPLLTEAGFDGTVAVQARSTMEETTWLLTLADAHPFIAGVVGWLDITSEDFAAQLERFCAYPKFCGVRCGIQTPAEDATQPTPAFIRGLHTLADFDKSFDLLIRPPQLPLAGILANAVPHLRFVLDHIANPDINGTISKAWADGIRQLALCPNVTCKLSGMVTRATHPLPPPTAFGPYLDLIFDAFGPQRLMIGSDWPVCTQAATYKQTIHIVQNYTESLSPTHRTAVLGENAEHIYQLNRGKR